MTGRDQGVLAPFRSLLGAQVIGTVLGLLFWVLVARLSPTVEVGVAAAAISTQTLLGLLVGLGLGTFLVGELPRHRLGRQHQLLYRSLGVVTLAGLASGGALVVLAGPLGVLGDSLERAVETPADALLLILGTVGAGWALVVDEASLGLRRSSLQVWRNLCAAGSRFPLVGVLLFAGERDATALQLAWVAPLLLSVAVLLVAVHRSRADETHGRLADESTTWGSTTMSTELRGLARPALRHHGLNLAVAAASQAVPVVAAVTLAPSDNGAFIIAWRVASVAFLPPYLVAVALYSHGASLDADAFRRVMGRTIPAALVLSLLLTVGAWALGRPGLRLFGEDYATTSYLLLCLLVPAGTWMVVKDHLVAWWRSRQQFSLATRLAAASMVLEVGGAAVGAVVAGSVGLAVGWLLAMVLSFLLSIRWWRPVIGGLAWQWSAPHPRAVTAASAEASGTGISGKGVSGKGVSGAGAAVGSDVSRVHDERGAVRPWLAAAISAGVVLVLGAGLLVGLRTLMPATGQGDDAETRGRGPNPAESCPADGREDLVLDLGIQAATGDPEQPLLPRSVVDELVVRAVAAGAEVVSTDVAWQDVVPTANARPRWRGLDRLLSAAAAHDLDVRVQLTGSPSWAVGAGDPSAQTRWQPPLTAAELAGWGDFVRSTLKHLDGRVDYVEVWNEPDNPTYWTTGVDPAAFARLLEATAPLVRRHAPQARIVTGGLAGNHIGYLRALYRHLPSGERPFDLVGVHPFAGSLPPDSEDPAARFSDELGPYDLTFTGFRDLHQVMVEAGDGDLGLYLGQFGYSTEPHGGYVGVPDDLRAEWLPAALDLAACDPAVHVLSWYYLHPTPWDPAPWTLLDGRLRPNLTYQALVAWSEDAA